MRNAINPPDRGYRVKKFRPGDPRREAQLAADQERLRVRKEKINFIDDIERRLLGCEFISHQDTIRLFSLYFETIINGPQNPGAIYSGNFDLNATVKAFMASFQAACIEGNCMQMPAEGGERPVQAPEAVMGQVRGLLRGYGVNPE